jgi:hypothetical protein
MVPFFGRTTRWRRSPRSVVVVLHGIVACMSVSGCSDEEPKVSGDWSYPNVPWVDPPACGASVSRPPSLVEGPSEAGFDGALAAKAHGFDRVFHVFNAAGTGVNADVSVPPEWTDQREAIRAFVQDQTGWDFEGHSGKTVRDVVGQWHKVAGAYAGVGIAADAYYYGTLRDEGAPCEDVDRARQFVIANLDALHLATAITGVPGVIARGFARRDLPGSESIETVPLLDATGKPLPEEKNNGTWREDNAGLYPEYVWEDSCSRDMLIGWVIGMAAVWEVTALDPTVPQDRKDRLRNDASAIARSLMQVGDRGYDLEVHDADGRITYHGYINENALDRGYLAGAANGMYGIMALGIVGGLSYVSREPDIVQYLRQDLIERRGLHLLARDNMLLDAGLLSNYSGYNMAFQGAWLAYRYLPEEPAREVIREAIATSLYARPGASRQPSEQKQTFYDFVQAVSAGRGTAFGPMTGPPDEGARARGVETLTEFWEPPYFAQNRLNCDDVEIESGQCIGIDGTPIQVLGYVGRNGELVASGPVPMRIRPASNYYWRSNPYAVNGGDDSGLYAANDFRFCYWMARWVTSGP